MAVPPTFATASFRPLSWFLLKPLSLNPAMSLMRAAEYPDAFVDDLLEPPSAAEVETVATSAAKPASAIQRETFTCPPSPINPIRAILARFTGNRKSLPLGERRFVDEHTTRLRALVAADDPAALEHVDEAARPRVTDSQAPLQERHRRRLRLHDDLDRLVEQRVVVGVELAVLALVLRVGEDLGQLQVALVELLFPLPRLLDDERDLLLGHVRALDALQPRGAERLEQHVALAEERLRAVRVEDDAGVRLRGDGERDPRGHVRLDHSGDHVHRRALRCEHKVDADGAGLLRQADDRVLDRLR